MKTEMTIEPVWVQTDALRLFSLYTDFPAGMRAKWLAEQVGRFLGWRRKVSASMWKLNLAASTAGLREMILGEALDSEVMVISISSLDQRDPLLDLWLEALAAPTANRRSGGLLIGLLGDDDHEAGELDGVVRQLALHARQVERDFIWRWMERDALYETSWLTLSLEQFLAGERTRRIPALNVSGEVCSGTARLVCP
jgi:hypothetical protein